MVTPTRKKVGRPKKDKGSGFQRDERLAEALPFGPGGAAVPGDGPGETASMIPSLTATRTGEGFNAPGGNPPVIPQPDSSLRNDASCPRAALCAVAEAICLTENHCGPCGAFTRQGVTAEQQQTPAPISTPGVTQVLDLRDTRKVLDLMYRARANREASEPRPAPRHWNGINFRSEF